MNILTNAWVTNNFFRQMDLTNNNKKIKAEKIFKEDLCAICLSNLSNILFCNCSHLCVCKECDKIGEGFQKCPMCNAINTNLRIIK